MTDKRTPLGSSGNFFAARECCNSGQFSPKYWWYLRVNPTMFKLIHLLQCTVSGNFMCATSLKYRFQQQQKQTDRRTEFPLIKRKILPQISQMHVHTMYIVHICSCSTQATMSEHKRLYPRRLLSREDATDRPFLPGLQKAYHNVEEGGGWWVEQLFWPTQNIALAVSLNHHRSLLRRYLWKHKRPKRNQVMTQCSFPATVLLWPWRHFWRIIQVWSSDKSTVLQWQKRGLWDVKIEPQARHGEPGMLNGGSPIPWLVSKQWPVNWTQVVKDTLHELRNV